MVFDGKAQSENLNRNTIKQTAEKLSENGKKKIWNSAEHKVDFGQSPSK